MAKFFRRRLLPLGTTGLCTMLSVPFLSPSPTSESKCKQRVYMWGRKESLPLQVKEDIRFPLKVPWFEENPFGWKSIDFGKDFGVAVTQTGELYVWGSVDIGSREPKKGFVPPFRIRMEAPLVDAQCSLHQLFALDSNGRVYLWDSVGPLLYQKYLEAAQPMTHQRGANSVVYSAAAAKADTLDANTVASLEDLASLYDPPDAIVATEQCGHSTESIRYTLLKGLPYKDWWASHHVVHMSVGFRHAAFVTDQGKLYCYGDNAFGQCGLNPLSDADAAYVCVPHKVSFGDKEPFIVKVKCGEYHTVVMDKEGNTYSIGDDSKLQLLLGDTRSTEATQADKSVFSKKAEHRVLPNRTAVTYGPYQRHLQFEPKHILLPDEASGDGAPLAQPIDLVAGGAFTVLKYKDSSKLDTKASSSNAHILLCGGENLYGQCGRTSLKHQQVLGAVKLPRHTAIALTSCGANHCLSSLESGDLFGWGFNNHGQTGTGKVLIVNPPKRIKYELNDSSESIRTAAPSSTETSQITPKITSLSCGFDNSAIIVEFK